jgi:hypothetical protein
MLTPPTAITPCLKDRISEALGTLQVPKRYDSVWIGPFEQLAGAGHSLIMSENLGFSSRKRSRTYFVDVQRKIVGLLQEVGRETASSDQDALSDWMSRYYFNSGIQRVDYAAERLIATFGGIDCTCGRAPDVNSPAGRWPTFRQRTDGAKTRLSHVKGEYVNALGRFEEIIMQLDPAKRYERNEQFDESRGLAMIRYHVNSRKHAIYLRSKTLDSLPTPSFGEVVTWSKVGNKIQMKTAVDCYVLACDAYAELVTWHPDAHD